MYSQKPNPRSFQKDNNKAKTEPVSPASIPIEAKEKTAEQKNRLFPLAALLFLDFFSTQKKDG